MSTEVNVKLLERLLVTEQTCWREKYLEISGIPESVSDSAMEDKIQEVLRGINIEVDTKNIA